MERVVISLLMVAVLMVETIGLTLSFQLSRTISRGLAEANTTTRAVGDGNFAARMPVRDRKSVV